MQKKRNVFLVLCCLLLSCLFPRQLPAFRASLSSINLMWAPNQETNVIGYRIHYGVKSGNYTNTLDVGNTTACTINSLPDGVYYFVVTAYNSSGDESDYSVERYVTINSTGNGAGTLTIAGSPVARSVDTVATVSWITNNPGTSTMEYGTSPIDENFTETSHDLVVAHTLAVTGLLPGTAYHYRVRSGDGVGNLTLSADMTFISSTQPSNQIQDVLTFPGPAVASSEDRLYTGVAVANHDHSAVLLTFMAFDQEGNPMSGPDVTNPAYRILLPSEQMAVMETDLFGSGPASDSVARIDMTSSLSGIASFFLIFDSSLSMMDGTVEAPPFRSVVFPEIAGDPELAADEAFTTFAVINPSASDEDVVFDLYTSDAWLARTIRRVNANGTLAASFSDLFPNTLPSTSNYVRASCGEPLEFFEFFGRRKIFLAALSGQGTAGQSGLLYAPQYAVGGSWITTVSVINLDSNDDVLSVRMIDKWGKEAGHRTLPIAANGKVHIPPDFFFSPGSAIQEGYLEISSNNGSHLAGDVVFGDANRSMYSSALPLVSTLGSSFILPHIASDQTYYTGIAVLNPGAQDMTVNLDLYSAAGQLEFTTAEVVPAGRRISKLLTQYFPALAGQSRTSGSVRLRSDHPAGVFALFGTYGGSSLAAIPALPGGSTLLASHGAVPQFQGGIASARRSVSIKDLRRFLGYNGNHRQTVLSNHQGNRQK